MKSQWAFKQLNTPLESTDIIEMFPTKSPVFTANVINEPTGLLQQVTGDISNTMKEVVVPVKTPLMDLVIDKVHTLVDFFF